MNEVISLKRLKRHLARQLFHNFTSRKGFPLINGKTLHILSEAIGSWVEFHVSICNAGLIPIIGGYTCVAKNQRFHHCDEMGTGEGREPVGKNLDDGVRVLYRIDFDVNWHVKSVQKLRVFLDGRSVDPVVFIEDVRLVVHKNSILAFANG